MSRYRLASRSTLEKQIASYLADTRDTRKSSFAAILHKELLAPIPEYFQSRHVIIIPDGELGFIPFDSLVDTRGRYVVETHTISYVPSATVLYLLRNGQRNEPALPLLAIGSSNPMGAKVSSFGRAAKSLFDPRSPVRVAALPSVADEISQVTKIVGYGDAALLGSEASEAEFKRRDLGRYRVIHIAAHGFADRKFPDRSGLLLGFDAANRDDGLLQVREIRDLQLHADLVTLSACDAGAGKLEGQNGIASIVQAFLFAGSQSVVASLWTANDTFTASLMARFYRSLSEGMPVGGALRAAKLQMIERFGQNAVPLLWAGFFVSGDPATQISFKQNHDYRAAN